MESPHGAIVVGCKLRQPAGNGQPRGLVFASVAVCHQALGLSLGRHHLAARHTPFHPPPPHHGHLLGSCRVAWLEASGAAAAAAATIATTWAETCPPNCTSAHATPLGSSSTSALSLVRGGGRELARRGQQPAFQTKNVLPGILQFCKWRGVPGATP